MDGGERSIERVALAPEHLLGTARRVDARVSAMPATVEHMMGAFAKLAASDKVDPSGLANDISLALITTCMGLFIAIPLILLANSITVRIRKMEDSVGSGLGQFFESLKTALEKR